MRLGFHLKVYSDIDHIVAHYKRAATLEIAGDFYGELRHRFMEACRRPRSFPIDSQGRRRVNLSRFPYHFLFRVTGDELRVLVVRHHRRHPSFGGGRR